MVNNKETQPFARDGKDCDGARPEDAGSVQLPGHPFVGEGVSRWEFDESIRMWDLGKIRKSNRMGWVRFDT